GEGGMLAFYAAAVDPRIDAALVSGYFKSHQKTYEEPLYRHVWGLLAEFGDAEIASLIAPRHLIVEYCSEPDVSGPPPVLTGQKKCAAPGKLSTPHYDEFVAEFDRLDKLVPAQLKIGWLTYVGRKEPSPPTRTSAMALLPAIGVIRLEQTYS